MFGRDEGQRPSDVRREVTRRGFKAVPRSPSDDASDEDLALCAQSGSVESFEQLMRRYQVPLLHFLRLRGACCDAEDLLQETFLRAYQNLHRYRRRWPFRTWVFTVARRIQLNSRRRQIPCSGEQQVEELASTALEAYETLEAEDDRQYLWSIAAGVLSEAELTALWLYYVEELPISEIGGVVGRSTGATKTMLSRARKSLAPFLTSLVDDKTPRRRAKHRPAACTPYDSPR